MKLSRITFVFNSIQIYFIVNILNLTIDNIIPVEL